MWQTVLEDEGVTVEAVDAMRVRLRSATAQGVFILAQLPGPVAPSQVPAPPGEPGLLVAPRASARAVEAATRAGWNVVTDAGTVALRIAGQVIRASAGRAEPDPAPPRRGPVPWGTFALARRLLAGPPATQNQLAARAGLSQSRVSRALAELAGAGLAERSPAGWRPSSWDDLADWWLARYRGAGGTASYWHGRGAPLEQTQHALKILQAASVRAAVSGDVAADALAPWRQPATALLYAGRGVSLARAGFILVSSAAEASLTLRVPRDQGVWLPSDWTSHGIPVAEPTQVIYDVATGAGPDRGEAAQHLREALRGKHARRWQRAVTGVPGA